MSTNFEKILKTSLEQSIRPTHNLNEMVIEKMCKYEEGKSRGVAVLRGVYRRAVYTAICLIAAITLFREPLLLCANAISEFVMEKYEVMKYAGLINDESVTATRSRDGYIISLDKVYYSEHEVVASVSVVGDGIGDFMRGKRTTQSPVCVSFDTKEGEKIFNNQLETMVIDDLETKEKIFGDVITAYNFNYSDYYNLTASWRGDEFLYEGKSVALNVDIMTPSDKYERIIFDVEFEKGLSRKENVVELNVEGIVDGMDYRVTRAIDTMTGLAICIDTRAACPENYIEIIKANGEMIQECEVVEIGADEKIIHYEIRDKELYPKYELNIADEGICIEFN